MRFRLATVAILAAAAQAPPRLSLVTGHESSTFTSIGGQDGGAVR